MELQDGLKGGFTRWKVHTLILSIACWSLEEDSITIFKFRGGRMSWVEWLRFVKEAQGKKISDLGVSLPSLVDVSSTTEPGEYSGQDSVVNLPVSQKQ